MSVTKIQWTDQTWNPVRGCSRVSPGCENCYAESIAARFSGEGLAFQGFAKRTKAGPRWTRKVELMPHKLAEPLSWKNPQRVFVNSMSDLFHEELSFEEIAAMFGVMAACPHLTFQVLTKRPERMREWFKWISDMPEPGFPTAVEDGLCRKMAWVTDGAGLPQTILGQNTAPWRWPLPNVWLGVSAEDQARADERIPLLLETPAAVRFVSYEPALGSVDFRRYLKPLAAPGVCIDIDGEWWHEPGSCHYCRPSIDWLILGGESGPGARPCDVTGWPELISRCREAGVAAFCKQVGANFFERTPVTMNWPGGFLVDDDDSRVWPILRDPKGGDPSEWPPELRVREFPKGV